MSTNFTFFGKFGGNPIFQSLFIALATTLLFAILKFFSCNEIQFWNIGGVALLFFCGVNGLVGIFKVKWSKYILISICCFVPLVIYLAWLSSVFSGIRFGQLSEFRQLFTALVIFYLMLTFLIAIYRMIAKNLEKY